MPCSSGKTNDNDGYSAVQIGYNPRGKAPNKTNKPAEGHAAKANAEVQHLSKEFRVLDGHELTQGKILTVEDFNEIPMVDVVSTTKGRGFQGVVKRWNFGGGPASHGSMFHRRGGSYGLCQWPGRVFKNKKMPGHMGDVQRTTQNLKIVKIIPEKNIILIKGSVPGHKGGILTIRTAKKIKVSK